jgi:hypothetical protein
MKLWFRATLDVWMTPTTVGVCLKTIGKKTMFNATPNKTANRFRSPATFMVIAKPLALMAGLLAVSPVAFAAPACDEEQTASATSECETGSTADTTYFLDWCSVSAGGDVSFECCTFGHCYGGMIAGGSDSDGEVLEDDYRGEPTDPSSTPDDADERVDEEAGLSDDDGDIRGTGDGDTDPDEGLEIGACCVDLGCIDDLTEDECEYEELGAWFASMDCADTVTECAAVDPDPSGDEDELVDEEPGLSDDDGDTGRDDDDTGDADIGDPDTGDDGSDTGHADDTSADDEDASVDDDDTQADGAVDTESEESDTSAGCSTVGQAGGGLMALILGAFLGLTRRQVRRS